MTDNSTLSVAVMLVMGLASIALIAHWLANRLIAGMGTLAFGLLLCSIGAGLVISDKAAQSEYWAFLGYILIMSGHMSQWLGLADFWQARTRMLAFVAKGMVLVGILGILYIKYIEGGWQLKVGFVAGTSALLLFGCVYTISQALGGSLGMYKGVVRITSVGSVIAAGLFLLHGFYAIYHAAVRIDFIEPVAADILPSLNVLAQFEIMLFSITFALVVIIITAERLHAELKIQEMLDPLTKALNKRAFIEVVKAVLARARRNSEPVSLIMMDIDHFKKINITHGRAVGDEALRLFADLVTDGRRAQDVFCRFGGEEFVFLLPGTPEEGAALVAERIKDRIEQSALTPKGVAVKLSISMGMVTERGDDLDADGMFDVVDRRMHRAQKLQFKNIESA
ncbi:MAG: GGDEF domain-containing protein [Kordiimonas sp.]